MTCVIMFASITPSVMKRESENYENEEEKVGNKNEMIMKMLRKKMGMMLKMKIRMLIRMKKLIMKEKIKKMKKTMMIMEIVLI